VIGALLIVFIVVQPFIGVRRWRRFLPRSDEPGARIRLYWRSIATAWAWTALIALGMIVSDWPPMSVGLVAPELGGGKAATMAILGIGFAVGLVVPLLQRRRFVRAFGKIAALLPRTRRERLWFVAVALSAGFCEELLHRGFLLAYVSVYAHAHPLPLWLCFVLGAVPFGLAHAYQGARNVFVTALFGVLATAMLVLFRSLWIPIVVHALVDLRAALLMPSAPAAGESASDRAVA
jgi:membrane protease YdiL (CAAX protease family)